MAATNPSPDVSWARWLQAQLDERGWRRSDLIERSPDVTKDRLSKWLRSEEVPRIAAIRSVCRTLGIPAVEGLVAAGHLEPADVGAAITQRIGVTGLTDWELLEEIARRLAEGRQPDTGTDVVTVEDPTPLRRRVVPVVEPEGVEGVDWAARHHQD